MRKAGTFDKENIFIYWQRFTPGSAVKFVDANVPLQ